MMNSENIKSIYIPRMHAYHTAESVKNLFETYGYSSLGRVIRVDFTPINKQPGFGEDVDNVVKSSFIHFDTTNVEEINSLWSHIYNGIPIKCCLNSNGVKFWISNFEHMTFKNMGDYKEYWILLKNKNPVQPTMMNIHQVVENGRHLEKLIMEQNKEIINLREIIKNQQEKIEELESIVDKITEQLNFRDVISEEDEEHEAKLARSMRNHRI